MKKLMIAVAAVVAVCTVNAAQFYWGGEEQIFAGYKGGSGEGIDGTGYLLWDSESEGGLQYASALAILADWSDGKAASLSGITGAKLDSLDVEGGSFENTSAEGLPGAAGNYYALFVTKDEAGKDWAYLSTEIPVDEIDPYGATFVIFENEATRSAGGTGWYTQSVPEPTSGLLLLLGMAGLALRRRRA